MKMLGNVTNLMSSSVNKGTVKVKKHADLLYYFMILLLIGILVGLFYYKYRSFINVICYPYSFPIGMMNSISGNGLGFCYKSQSADGVLSNDMGDEIDHTFGSGILTKNQVKNVAKIIKNNISEIDNAESMKMASIQSSDVDLKIDLNWYENAIQINPSWHGEGTKRMVFCKPNVSQNISGFLSRESKISNENKDNIVNEISGHISTNLNEMGNKESNHEGQILSSNEVKNKIFSSIDNEIRNMSAMDVKTNNTIKYTDNWGICYDGKSNNIKQDTQVELVSKNIIKVTTELIMKNNTKINSDLDVTINRVDNRTALVAFLLNFIVLYLFISTILKIF